jgi:branched-chain amino acid transport system substrate-binding protein
MRRRTLLKTAPAAVAAYAMPSLALSQTRPVKIGLVTDYTGPYRDNNGPGEEYGIQLAIQDFNNGKVLGRPIELLVADHLNKSDVSSDITKRWLEVEKVDMMVPSGSSVAALAAHILARDRGVITQMSASAAINFTEQDCSPLGFHWQPDTYAYPRSGVFAAGENARKKWFFISIDNVFGSTAFPVAQSAIQEAGGQVIGNVKFPINTTDYASFIAQAQASRADVVAILSSGTDLIRALRQAREFGVQAGGQVVMSPAFVYTDILAAGLEVAQGMRFADGFYWNTNDATRAYSARFQEKIGRKPAGGQAQVYAAVTHYLQAVEAAKTTEGKVVAAMMKSRPITQGFWTKASIRPNGRVVYDMTLMQVKGPGQSKDKFDVAEVIGSIPGEKVFKPLAKTECKYV